MKSTILKIGFVAALATIVSGEGLVSASKESKETLAVATLVVGHVEVYRDGKTKTVRPRTFFTKDDTIVTKKGKVNLQIGPSAILRIAPQSVVVMKNLAEFKNGSNVEIAVKKGTLYSKIVKKLNRESSFVVRTPALVAAVRGTEFAVSDLKINEDLAKNQNNENLPSGVYVNTGKVKVDSESGESVNVNAGEEVIATGEKLKKQILEAFVKRKLEIFKKLDVMKESNYKMLKAQKERGEEAMRKIKERNRKLREKIND